VHITGEGKIGIILALIGIAGAGAIMIWPDQTFIGWLLIATAVIGGLGLAIKHIVINKVSRFAVLSMIGTVLIVAGALASRAPCRQAQSPCGHRPAPASPGPIGAQ
jgi:asparagine N-glycosylation enzyme membrane subunit Stt3